MWFFTGLAQSGGGWMVAVVIVLVVAALVVAGLAWRSGRKRKS